jgi:hypothetical protein
MSFHNSRPTRLDDAGAPITPPARPVRIITNRRVAKGRIMAVVRKVVARTYLESDRSGPRKAHTESDTNSGTAVLADDAGE